MRRRTTVREAVFVFAMIKPITDALTHESCGVDSFSLQDRALEYLACENFREESIEEILATEEDLTDDVARSIVLYFEVQDCLGMLAAGIPLVDVLKSIRERFFIN